MAQLVPKWWVRVVELVLFHPPTPAQISVRLRQTRVSSGGDFRRRPAGYRRVLPAAENLPLHLPRVLHSSSGAANPNRRGIKGVEPDDIEQRAFAHSFLFLSKILPGNGSPMKMSQSCRRRRGSLIFPPPDPRPGTCNAPSGDCEQRGRFAREPIGYRGIFSGSRKLASTSPPRIAFFLRSSKPGPAGD